MITEPSDINGAVVQSRRQADRISVWTRSSDESTRQVAENYQKLVKSSTGLKFQSHLNRTSSLNLRYLGIRTKNYVTKIDILIVRPYSLTFFLGQTRSVKILKLVFRIIEEIFLFLEVKSLFSLKSGYL